MTGSGWRFGALNASRQAGQAVIMSWPIGAGMILFIASGALVFSATRKQIPEQERPFKVPGGHTIPAVAFWSSNLIVYWSGWDTVWKLMPAVDRAGCWSTFSSRSTRRASRRRNSAWARRRAHFRPGRAVATA